ncbi:MAG: hypothetical protein ACI9R3_002191 [Verrucomicrobiales bacterium]
MKLFQTPFSAVLVALLATTSVAKPEESFSDFLEEGLEASSPSQATEKKPKINKGKGKRFKGSKEDAIALEALVEESAEAAGVTGDYELYSERLAKTLSMLALDQQANIFD